MDLYDWNLEGNILTISSKLSDDIAKDMSTLEMVGSFKAFSS
jgi:hypothetical protein